MNTITDQGKMKKEARLTFLRNDYVVLLKLLISRRGVIDGFSYLLDDLHITTLQCYPHGHFLTPASAHAPHHGVMLGNAYNITSYPLQ